MKIKQDISSVIRAVSVLMEFTVGYLHCIRSGHENLASFFSSCGSHEVAVCTNMRTTNEDGMFLFLDLLVRVECLRTKLVP